MSREGSVGGVFEEEAERRRINVIRRDRSELDIILIFGTQPIAVGVLVDFVDKG